MSDDRFAIPLLPSPEPTEKAPHPLKRSMDTVALIISLLAATIAGFACYYAYRQAIAAESQAQIATAGLEFAKKAANDQAADVERSRKAAEESAKLAPWRNAPGDEVPLATASGPEFEVAPGQGFKIQGTLKYSRYQGDLNRSNDIDCQITYKDQFNDQKPHSNTFCFRFRDALGREPPTSCGYKTD